MEKSNLYALIEPLKSKPKIDKLFDLIESKFDNKASLEAFIKDIERTNFTIYKKETNPPERIKFNKSIFDFYINEKLKATQRKKNNQCFDFNDNLVYYLERLAKVLSIIEYDFYSKEISINEQIIRELSEYIKTNYCEKEIENIEMSNEEANIFTSKGFKFFNYCIENYKKGTTSKVKFQYIFWYFNSRHEPLFTPTKSMKLYSDYINKKFSIGLKEKFTKKKTSIVQKEIDSIDIIYQNYVKENSKT